MKTLKKPPPPKPPPPRTIVSDKEIYGISPIVKFIQILEKIKLIKKIDRKIFNNSKMKTDDINILNEYSKRVIKTLKKPPPPIRESNYRIAEFDGKFSIEKKTIDIVTTGLLWWRKKKYKTIYKKVDKYGSCLYKFTFPGGVVSNYHQELKSFNNLKEALSKIYIFEKGIIYHYPENNYMGKIISNE